MSLSPLGLCIVVLAQVAGPQPEEKEANGKNSGDFAKLALKEAGEYEAVAGGKKLELHNQSVLNWSNPAVGEIYGGVFVWTHDGRPQLILSLYKWYSPHSHMTHEFHSLSTQELTATRNNRGLRSAEGGVSWQPVPNAPPPGISKPQRMSQMRRIAKLLTVDMTEKDQSVIRLRLLTQPLMRYESKAADVVDGALFCFAKGTDPETLLLMEARDGAWHFAFARFNETAMQATMDGNNVWNVEQLNRSTAYAGDRPYSKFQFYR